MHRIKRWLFGVIMVTLFIPKVGAVSCENEKKAQYNREVSNVSVNYEIKEEVVEDAAVPDSLLGTEYEDQYQYIQEYIQVNILNITENMYVEVTNDVNDDEVTYQYSDTTDGTLSFEWREIGTLIKYTIKVYTSEGTDCGGNLLRTLSIQLPRYNMYSEFAICNQVTDYTPCDRFVFSEDIEEGTFMKNIRKEIEKEEQKKQEEEENQKWYNKVSNFIKEHKVFFIVTGGILVVAAGTAAVVIIRKRRRSII